MTLRKLRKSRIAFGILAIVGGFVGLYYLFEPKDLIVLLNGLFAGSLLAIGLQYRKLLLDALVGDGGYDRYRQMTLSIFLQWVVICIGVMTSIYINAADLPTLPFTAVAFARYLATVTAFIQITSPYVGYHYSDTAKRSFIFSVGAGLSFAAAIIWLQGV